MALVIRLRQQGKKNRHSFRIVVADRRFPRDGKYVEKLGWYDPFAESGKDVTINNERMEHWLHQGALLSENVEALVKRAAPEVLKKKEKAK